MGFQVSDMVKGQTGEQGTLMKSSRGNKGWDM